MLKTGSFDTLPFSGPVASWNSPGVCRLPSDLTSGGEGETRTPEFKAAGTHPTVSDALRTLSLGLDQLATALDSGPGVPVALGSLVQSLTNGHQRILPYDSNYSNSMP